MKINFKRIISGALALAMAVSMSACGNTQDDSSNVDAGNAGGGALFSEPTEIKVVISDHVSWPYNQNWKVWQYFEEATGADFNVTAIPESNFVTKLNLMMAGNDTLPDLLHLKHKAQMDEYALAGALVPADDYVDRMPNYTAFLETLPENIAIDLQMQRRAGDGKIYGLPTYGTQEVNGMRTWMYRKDIFEKHNLKVPETYEELYQVAKKLKELYPDSYPLCFREGMNRLGLMSSQWKEYFSYDVYYDFNDGKWHMGAAEDTMKQLVTYLSKLREEGLVTPDFLNINTKTWEELMSTDRGFISIDYIVRLDFFNIPSRAINPDYTLATMKPPRADIETGKNTITRLNFDFTGYTVCNTGDKKRIENAFKVIDWMYSDEGSELLSWGKEGETYQVVNGEKEFILPNEGDTCQTLYGIATAGVYQRIDEAAFGAVYTKEQAAQSRAAAEYLEPNVNPMWWLSFTEEEAERKAQLKDNIDSYIEEMLSKFMLGQTPISEWDSFAESLQAMGVDEMLEIYAAAYNRVKG